MGVIEDAKALLEKGNWQEASVLLDVPRATVALHGWDEDDDNYVKRLKAVVGMDEPQPEGASSGDQATGDDPSASAT